MVKRSLSSPRILRIQFDEGVEHGVSVAAAVYEPGEIDSMPEAAHDQAAMTEEEISEIREARKRRKDRSLESMQDGQSIKGWDKGQLRLVTDPRCRRPT